MKYVMIEHNGVLYPVIFPNELVHSYVFAAMREMLIRKHAPDGVWNTQAISAGFLLMGDVACHGESESLKIKSRYVTDAQMIRTRDYNAGKE